MSTKPVLYYFDLPARGEAIRLAFAIGHIEFEDFRVSHEEWLTKYKPLTPAGQLPVLELGDMKYCESQAILMYAAKRAGLVPEEPEHLLSMCQAINGLERIWSINGLLYRAKPEETDQVRKELCEAWKMYAKMIGRTQHEKGFIAGDKLSAADLAVYACTRRIPSFDFPQTLIDGISEIKKVIDLVDSVPEVKQYYKV